jgi:integrase
VTVATKLEANEYAAPEASDYAARLAALLDGALLTSLGWDAEATVFSPPPNHPTLIWIPCARCGRRESTGRHRLCHSCLEAGSHWLPEPALCRVCRTPGHERPAHTQGLCVACEGHCRHLGLSFDAYVQSVYARPRLTFGKCRAAVCDKWAARPCGLCHSHWLHWKREGKPDLEQWSRWAKPLAGSRAGKLHFMGLPAVVRDELLFGLQTAHQDGYRCYLNQLRPILDAVRDQRVSRLADLPRLETRDYTRFLTRTRDAIALALADREAEVEKDVWDLRLWNLRGFLRFDGSAQPRTGQKALPAIAQIWLRQAAKRVSAQRLARGCNLSDVQRVVGACGFWSQYLALREDHGVTPSALRNSDATQFVLQLTIRERNGEISNQYAVNLARALRQFLQDVHEQGLAAPVGPCAGLPSEVTLTRRDMPKPSSSAPEDEVGEALPAAVLRQLLAPSALALLSADGQRRIRIGLEVGRRPTELLSLPYECLKYDEAVDPATGATTRLPVLVHDMPKVGRIGYRLPVTQATADQIVAQQAAALARFPGVPTATLVLWPARDRNAHGARPMTAGSWVSELRRWLAQLQLVDGDVAPDGTVVARLDPVGKPVLFPSERVYPYAFRHTFAQRHIDAGTPVQTLQDLMGHANIHTTMGYYTVKMDKRRAAVEKLGPLQVTAFGVRVVSQGSLASATARYEVGQVAVPFGTCVEPANVQAHGQSCQFRHRCFGCAHFRTDPSYLPELRAYLGELLLAKERLTMALPDLAEWARAEALPQDDEIATVRRLIAACERALEHLPDEERRVTEEAIAVLREARNHLDATFPVQFRGLVVQPEPSVFPILLRSSLKRMA